MVDVTTTILISEPLQAVSGYSSDPDHAPEWYRNIKSVVWQTPRPFRTGSRIAFVAHFLGRKLSYTYEVTELSGNSLVMKTAEGPFPMETTYLWEALDANTTKMTLRNRGNPSGFSKIFAPFMARMMRKENQKDLAMLKEILETKSDAS